MNGIVSLYNKLKRNNQTIPDDVLEEFRRYHRNKKQQQRSRKMNIIPWKWSTDSADAT
jgi:hypothetical protein